MSGDRQSQEKNCVHEGCKAYRQKGSIYCYSHNPANLRTGGAPSGNQNARRHGLYAHYFTEQEMAFLDEAAEGGEGGGKLEHDIDLLSLVIGQLYREGKFVDASLVVTRKGRLLEVAKKLAADGADDLAKELEKILEEVNNPIGFKVKGV